MSDSENPNRGVPEAQIASENQEYLAEISKLTGVPIPDIQIAELKALYQNNFVRGKSYSSSPYRQKYLGSFSPYSDRFYQLVEALADIPAGVLSYGLFLREYQAMLKEYNSLVKADNHSSLLVGGLTTATIKEYVRAVRSVFPQATCRVVDIEERNMGDSGAGFEIADALSLPGHLAGTFDTLYTNALLRNIQGGHDRWDIDGNRISFLTNAHRVLRPNGALIMVDWVTDNNGWDNPRRFEENLRETGFQDVQIHPAKQFLYRRHMERVFRGTGDISHAPLTNSPLFSIFARKKG